MSSWLPGLHYLQGSRSQIHAVCNALLLDVLARPGHPHHFDGGGGPDLGGFVQQNKRRGRRATAGLERVRYQCSLNAHDWHTILTETCHEVCRRWQPSLLLVTDPLDHLMNHRMDDKRASAYLRHGLEELGLLAEEYHVPCIWAGNFQRISHAHVFLAQQLRESIPAAHQHRILGDEDRLFVVPWSQQELPPTLRRQRNLDDYLPAPLPVLEPIVVEVA